MNKFLRDLAVGQQGEATVKVLLSKLGINSQSAEGKNADYDLRHDAPVLWKSEVKFDIASQRTKNVAIEFYNPKQGKATGIAATKADIWFHILPQPFSTWAVAVPTLRRYIKEEKPYHVIASGGDDNASFYLYRQDRILDDIFEKMDGCEKDVLCDKLVVLLEAAGKM
jgi:hypothetical protein